MILEPLQNVQMSWSKFQVTSFIDFQTYLNYFYNYEGYLDKFMDSIMRVPEQPLYRRFMRDKGGILSHALAPAINLLGAGLPQKPTMRQLTLKGGAIKLGKIMSPYVGIGTYMHVWYSVNLIGY